MEGCVGGVQMFTPEVRIVLSGDDAMLLTERKEDMANSLSEMKKVMTK